MINEHFDLENDAIPFHFIELSKARYWYLPKSEKPFWVLFKNTG
jgi:hypothetical protein